MSDLTGMPAPKKQDMFEVVDIDENVAACESHIYQASLSHTLTAARLQVFQMEARLLRLSHTAAASGQGLREYRCGYKTVTKHLFSQGGSRKGG